MSCPITIYYPDSGENNSALVEQRLAATVSVMTAKVFQALIAVHIAQCRASATNIVHLDIYKTINNCIFFMI
jgi:hypothetical protein